MKGIGNGEGGGVVGGAYLYTIYIYVMQKLVSWDFASAVFQIVLALKIYIFMRGYLIKTKVMDKGH